MSVHRQKKEKSHFLQNESAVALRLPVLEHGAGRLLRMQVGKARVFSSFSWYEVFMLF